MDTLFEILGEIFIEVYLELMMLIVPESKVNKGLQIAAKIFAILMIILLIASLVIGASLIEKGDTVMGITFISVAAALSLVQIILGIVFYFPLRVIVSLTKKYM